MVVKQIMQKDLVTVLPSSTLFEAALKMKEHCIGSVLVCEEGGKLKGIITDRDIALAVAADSKDPKSTFAYEIMTADPIAVNADADVDSALRIMNRAKIRKLPVMESGKVVGLLSSADLASEIRHEVDQFISLEETFARH